MAVGQVLKKEITDKILNTFEGSFLYNDGKEIRIPGVEDGNNLQIKITLTCAKTNVSQGDDVVLPGETEKVKIDDNIIKVNLSEEERTNVENMLKSLGF